LQALLALHGLWFITFVGLARWIANKWPPGRVKLLGTVLCVLGLAGVSGLTAHDILAWSVSGSSVYQKYIVQRTLYVVGTTPDIPVLPMILTGIVLRVGAQWASRRHREQLGERGSQK
jgi:hypothetical protein